VRVQDIVLWHDLLGMAPEEIVARNPGLGMADLYAALAYYDEHADEIRRHMEEDEALANELKAGTASKLAHKLAAWDGGDEPLPHLDEHVARAVAVGLRGGRRLGSQPRPGGRR